MRHKKLLAAIVTCSLILVGCQAGPENGTPESNTPTPAPAETDDLRIEAPLMHEVVSSPLTIKGKVRGYWMFEAIFDIRLEDMDGRELATAPGVATDSWMTEDFVPFEAEMEFIPGNATEGKIIFLEAFPAGGLEGNTERRTFEMPVRFTDTE